MPDSFLAWHTAALGVLQPCSPASTYSPASSSKERGCSLVTWSEGKARPASVSPQALSSLEGDTAGLGAQKYLGAVHTRGHSVEGQVLSSILCFT